MAKYTIELRRVCDIYSREEVENWFKSYNLLDYLTSEEVEKIESVGLWDKDKLARKIVNHYFMREIGFETPALFKHYAKVTMEELMEQKLPLIYSSSIKYDPLVNVDYTETFERSQTGEVSSSGNSTSSSGSLSINNNTPQKRVNRQDLNNGLYANNVNQSDINNETQTGNSGNSSSDENYTKRIKGNSGVSATAQKMIEQFRQNIIAIDKEIIEELNILFMGLY